MPKGNWMSFQPNGNSVIDYVVVSDDAMDWVTRTEVVRIEEGADDNCL